MIDDPKRPDLAEYYEDYEDFLDDIEDDDQDEVECGPRPDPQAPPGRRIPGQSRQVVEVDAARLAARKGRA